MREHICPFHLHGMLGRTTAARHLGEDQVQELAPALDAAMRRHIPASAGMSPGVSYTSHTPSLTTTNADLLTRIRDIAAALEASRQPADPGPDREWLRLPGLFRRFELGELLAAGDEHLIEEEGCYMDGTPLFAMYTRPHVAEEG